LEAALVKKTVGQHWMQVASLALICSLMLCSQLDTSVLAADLAQPNLGAAAADGDSELRGLVTAGVQLVAVVGSVYLTIGIITTFLEGQVASMTEQPGVKAQVIQRISLLVLCLAVIAFAKPFGDKAEALFGTLGTDPEKVVSAILEFGQFAASIVIGLVVIVMAVGVVFGVVDTQLQAALGQPVGLSTAMQRITGVVILGVGGLLSIVLTRLFVSALNGF
jgi:hypothetical protein